MVKSKDESFDKAFIKGISPVVATILMVMITVVLVAFSYSWLQNTVTGTQEQTNNVISQADKLNQKVEIATVYKCGQGICFQLRALTTNSYSVEMNGTSYYIDEVPQNLLTWDGGVSGTPCLTTTLLAPGQSCYGNISYATCSIGSKLTASLSWGTSTAKSISKCN